MNKSVKIAIGVLALVVIIGGVILWFAYRNKPNTEIKIAPNVNSQEMKEKEVARMVMVNGKLYYDTGKESDSLRCGMMDGKITSYVEATQTPTIDGQANFEGEYGYQYGAKENTIEICMDDKWCIFEAKDNKEEQYFFYGVVKEANQHQIIIEPYENEQIRKSADKIAVGLSQYSDALYEVGTNVKVTYTGYVMETYPTQGDTILD